MAMAEFNSMTFNDNKLQSACMEKAINIAVMVHDNEGGLTDDRIRDIAQQQIVDPGELIEKVKQKFTTKKG